MNITNTKKIAALFIVIFVLIMLIFCVSNCSSNNSNQDQSSTNGTVHLMAVGDNLPEEKIGYAGRQSDGTYNYDFIYNNVKPYIQNADLSLITSETCLGGNEIGPQAYPVFNARDEIADSVEHAGFDIVALAGNHSFDHGTKAAYHNVEVWESKNLVSLGMHKDQEDADRLRTKSIKGINFAFLDYTYGVNGYSESSFKPWQINFFDKDKINEDVKKARSQADVVVVFAHWGTEKTAEVNKMQMEYGQLFADLGVDIVVGSHPHVIQPMTWITGKKGNSMLMTYSLGNFNSNFDNKNDWTQIEGMLNCDISKEENNIKISNVKWVPLVNHNEDGNYTVYALKDYTTELSQKQPYLNNLEDPIAFIKDKTSSIVNSLGNNFVIDEVTSDENTSDSERTISH